MRVEAPDGTADAVDRARALWMAELAPGIVAVLAVEFRDRSGTIGMAVPGNAVDEAPADKAGTSG